MSDTLSTPVWSGSLTPADSSQPVSGSGGLVVRVTTMPTPIGPLTIMEADGIVRAGGFTEDVAAMAGRLGPALRGVPVEPVADLGAISVALRNYFAGNISALDAITVEQHGGPFQQRVWAALRSLPPGEQTTYRMLATQLGGPQYARAVGMGCATNLISPIVPCHRVTRTGGALAGYFWGLDRKHWLLDHERQHQSHS
jgi:methylated-DNA-[protein]-cysteine S-methyltransferase